MLPLRVECENIHHTPNSPLSAPGGKSDNTTPTHVGESNFRRDMCWGTLTLYRQHRALTFIVNPSTYFLFLPLGQIRIQHIHNTCSRVGLQPPHVLACTKQEFVTQLGATHAPAAPHDSTQHTLPLSAPGGKSEDNPHRNACSRVKLQPPHTVACPQARVSAHKIPHNTGT